MKPRKPIGTAGDSVDWFLASRTRSEPFGVAYDVDVAHARDRGQICEVRFGVARRVTRGRDRHVSRDLLSPLRNLLSEERAKIAEAFKQDFEISGIP